MENEFLKRYKTKYDRITVEPPPEIWEAIRDSRHPGQQPVASRNRQYLGLSLLFLFLCIGIGSFVFIQEENSSSNGHAAVVKKSAKPGIEIPGKSNFTGSVPPKTNIADFSPDAASKRKPLPASITKTTSRKSGHYAVNTPVTGNNEVLSADLMMRNRMRERKSGFEPGTLSLVEMTSFYPTLTVNEDAGGFINNTRSETRDSSPEIRKPNKFYAGISYRNNNCWLLNNQTFSGYQSGVQNESKLLPGKAITLEVGYDLTKKYALQLNCIPENQQGQRYLDYVEGHSISRDIELHYIEMSFLGKRKYTGQILNGKLPYSVNCISGFNLGYLKSAFEIRGGQAFSVNQEYYKFNLAFSSGLEGEIFPLQRFSLNISALQDIGLRNMYTGNGNIPFSFNKTYNYRFSAVLGVRYYFQKK